MKVIVDRIEEDYIVVELNKKEFYNIPKQLLNDVKEGNVVEIKVLKGETKKRQDNINNLVNNLFE